MSMGNRASAPPSKGGPTPSTNPQVPNPYGSQFQPQRYSNDYFRYQQSGEPFNQPVMGYGTYGQIFTPPPQRFRPQPIMGGKGGGMGYRPPPPIMGGKGGGMGNRPPPTMGGKGGGMTDMQYRGPQRPPVMGGKGGQGFQPFDPRPRIPRNPGDRGFRPNQPPREIVSYPGGSTPGGFGAPMEELINVRPAVEPNYGQAPGDMMLSTQALIPATQNGVSGYYTDGSQRNFVPYSSVVEPARTINFDDSFQQQQQMLQAQALQNAGGPTFQTGTYTSANPNVASPFDPNNIVSTEEILRMAREEDARNANNPQAMMENQNALLQGQRTALANQELFANPMAYTGDMYGLSNFARTMQFQEGGQVPPDAASNMEMMLSEAGPANPQAEMAGEYDRLIQMTMQAVLGQVEQPDEIIQMFIDEFGVDAFRQLREAVLKQQVPNAQTEGMVDGNGGGMDDQVMGMIGAQRPVAVSPGEYIIPADVVSGLGDGSSKSGADILDELSQAVRMARTGTPKQPRPLLETLSQ